MRHSGSAVEGSVQAAGMRATCLRPGESRLYLPFRANVFSSERNAIPILLHLSRECKQCNGAALTHRFSCAVQRMLYSQIKLD